MKKSELIADLEATRFEVEELRLELGRQRDRAARAESANRRLRAEVEQMREHWRPVPIVHEWQPKERCRLCDEPRASARHRVDTP